MSLPPARRVAISWTGADGAAYHFSLDATLQENHRLAAEVTTHPVEQGADVADHIRPLPDELELTGRISNTPIHVPDSFADGAQFTTVEIKGAAPTVGNSVGRVVPVLGALAAKIPLPLPTDTGVVQGFTAEFDRVRAVWGALRTIRDSGLLCMVTTTLDTYTDMALAEVAAPRTGGDGNAVTLNMTFRKVRKGTATAVPVPVLPTKKVSKGAAALQDATPPVEASTLFHLFGED